MDEEILEFRLTERATFLEFLPERHDLARCISAPELLGGGFCRADEKASSSFWALFRVCFVDALVG